MDAAPAPGRLWRQMGLFGDGHLHSLAVSSIQLFAAVGSVGANLYIIGVALGQPGDGLFDGTVV